MLKWYRLYNFPLKLVEELTIALPDTDASPSPNELAIVFTPKLVPTKAQSTVPLDVAPEKVKKQLGK